MMEDFAKVARYETFSFSDAALITCLANDHGFENAIAEWLKIYFKQGDILIAISSSGESKNILNAADYVLSQKASLITLTGFNDHNKLHKKGEVNLWNS
jgi:D-sedoheptulose 7-phosphate isomerase